MASVAEKIRKGWRELRGNIVVELAKWIGGSSVVGAFFKVISQAAHHVPVDWLLFVCLVFVGGLLIAYSLYRDGRTATADHQQPPAGREYPEGRTKRQWEEYCESVAFQNKLIELGRSVDGLFDPLQIEAMRLRSDLLQFRKECGPFPPPPENDRPPADRIGALKWQQEVVNSTIAWTEEYSVWARKLIYGYRERFAPRVLKLMNGAGSKTGVVVNGLEAYTQDVRPGDDFDQLIGLLEQLVWKVETSPTEHVFGRIWKMIDDMTGDEYMAAIRNPAFANMVNELPPKGMRR
jgi:hypothetical protein